MKKTSSKRPTRKEIRAEQWHRGGLKAYAALAPFFDKESRGSYNNPMPALAQILGRDRVLIAKAKLEVEIAVLKEKVRDAVEREDFAPFLDAVAHYRFSLFEDDYFLALAEKIDWAALQGDKTATKTLTLLLARLAPGRGKTGSPTLNEEETRQKWRTKQQSRRGEISQHKKKLDDLLQKEDLKALKKVLADWTNGKDTQKKTAAAEWKKKRNRTLR